VLKSREPPAVRVTDQLRAFGETGPTAGSHRYAATEMIGTARMTSSFRT